MCLFLYVSNDLTDSKCVVGLEMVRLSFESYKIEEINF